jgi:hypothetical protein
LKRPNKITINGKQKTFEELAEETGLNVKTLYGRWIRTRGRPTSFKGFEAAHLLRKRTYQGSAANEQFKLVMPDNKLMSISEILLQPWCSIKRTAAERRFKKANGKLHRDDFLPIERNQRSEGIVRKEKGLKPTAEWRKMSATKNTGRGKGEIPEDVWAKMYGGRLKALFFDRGI